MVITQYLAVRKKYHQGFRRNTNKIRKIVVHGTGGGGSAKSILNWMEDGEFAKKYKKGRGLFHYLIGLQGDIYEIIDPDRWVYHSSSGRHDKTTIGIELVNPSIDNLGGYTLEQYSSLVDMSIYLMGKYHNIDQIIGHGKVKKIYSKSYKNCPGQYFDWKALSVGLTTEGYQYKMCKEHIKDIERSYYLL